MLGLPVVPCGASCLSQCSHLGLHALVWLLLVLGLQAWLEQGRLGFAETCSDSGARWRQLQTSLSQVRWVCFWHWPCVSVLVLLSLIAVPLEETASSCTGDGFQHVLDFNCYICYLLRADCCTFDPSHHSVGFESWTVDLVVQLCLPDSRCFVEDDVLPSWSLHFRLSVLALFLSESA